MDFEWDDAKAQSNERKHGVAFSQDYTRVPELAAG